MEETGKNLWKKLERIWEQTEVNEFMEQIRSGIRKKYWQLIEKEPKELYELIYYLLLPTNCLLQPINYYFPQIRI